MEQTVSDSIDMAVVRLLVYIAGVGCGELRKVFGGVGVHVAAKKLGCD